MRNIINNGACFILFFVVFLYTVTAPVRVNADEDVDLKIVEDEIVKNPSSFNKKLLLAVYHLGFNENLDKALKIVEDVLVAEPGNQNALFLLKQIKEKQAESAQPSAKLLEFESYKKYSDLKQGDLDAEQEYPAKKVSDSLPSGIDAKSDDQLLLDKYKISDVSDDVVIKLVLQGLFQERRFPEFKQLYATLERSGIEFTGSMKLLRTQLNAFEREREKMEVDDSFFNNISDEKHLTTLASTLYSMGEFKRSQKIYEKLFNANPSPENGFKLIDIYLNFDEFEKAEMILYSMKHLDVSEAELSEIENQLIEYKSKRLEEAKKVYNEFPDFERLKRYIALLLDFGRAEEVESLIKGYLVVNIQNKTAKLDLANYLAGLGSFKEAIAVLYSMESLNDPEVKLMLGKTLYWDKQYEKAMNYFSEVIDQAAGKQVAIKAKKDLGFIYIWQNDFDEARELFREVLKENPADEEVKEELLVLDKNVQSLIEKYEDLHEENKDYDLYKYKLARFYKVAGNLDKSIFYYELYSENRPEDLNIYNALANLYLLKKSYTKAFINLEYYSQKIGTPESLFMLAKTYSLVGYYEQSLEILDKLLDKYGAYSNALKLKNEIVTKREVAKAKSKVIQMGFQAPDMSKKRLKSKFAKQLRQAEKLYADGFFKAALPYFQIYLVNETEDYEIRFRYALTLEKSKKHAEAAGEFSLMLDVTKDADVEYHYAYNLEKIGRINEAREKYQLVMAEKPQSLPEYLSSFLKIWSGVWERKDFDLFSSLYSKEIREDKQWQEQKIASFNARKPVSVKVSDGSIIFKRKGRILLKFYQDFQFEEIKEKGYKILELECDEKEECYILSERFLKGEQKNLDSSIFKLAQQRAKELEKVQDDEITRKESLAPQIHSLLEPRPIGSDLNKDAFISLDDECMEGDDCSEPEKIATEISLRADDGSVFAVAKQRLSGFQGGPGRGVYADFSGKKEELGALASILNQATPPYGFENYFYPELLSTSSVNIGPLKLMTSTEYLLGDSTSLKDLFMDEIEALVFTKLIGMKWYWYRNAADTRFNNLAVYYETPIEYIGIDAKAEAGRFTIQDDEGEETGSYLHVSGAKYNLELGLQFYNFDKFLQVNPYVKYRYALDEHALEFIYYRRNAGLIAKYSTCPIREEIDGDNLQINDYVELEDGNHFWGAVDFTRFTDSNIAVTPQFNFYFHNGSVGLLEYKYLLFGWYNFNTTTTACYYSPTAYDSTWFGVELDYGLTNEFSILGKAALGYSLTDNTSLYQIGGWVEYELANGFYAKAGCSKHNSQQNTALSTVFDYEECEAIVEYRW